jgi:hypothetical protein
MDFGRNYKEGGLFCRVCLDQVRCQVAMLSSQEVKNKVETHKQELPTVIFPGHAETITPQMAAELVKKKKVAEPDLSPKTGVKSKLKIPFEAGTPGYSRAYYLCRKRGKSFLEVSDEYYGKNSLKPIEEVPVILANESRVPSPGPSKNELFEEMLKILKEISIGVKNLNTNISAMNGNILEIRQEMKDLHSVMKKHKGG